jgi:hypothetical protein
MPRTLAGVGGLLRRLILGLTLLLAAVPVAWAHDPLFIEATVTVDGESVTVTITTRQAVVRSGINERGAAFASRQEFDQLDLRVAQWLLEGTALSADGQPVALGYLGADDGPLAEPLPLRLTGALPKGTRKLTLTLSLMKRLDGMFNVLDNVRLAGPATQAVTVGCGQPAELDLAPDRQTTSGDAQPPASVGTFPEFVRLGFLHIVPEGIDHILFVLGLFLLSPKLKPLLTQVTAFTVAHSLTLGLSLAGIFTLPSRIVEPLIAASIAVVALENTLSERLRPGRWMIVFAFGLVHGLGFAGALKNLRLPPGMILKPLIGFNLGVELGQLSVIAAAATLTWWCWKRPWYRRVVVVPASLLIAAVGLFWAIQRALGYGIEP